MIFLKFYLFDLLIMSSSSSLITYLYKNQKWSFKNITDHLLSFVAQKGKFWVMLTHTKQSRCWSTILNSIIYWTNICKTIQYLFDTAQIVLHLTLFESELGLRLWLFFACHLLKWLAKDGSRSSYMVQSFLSSIVCWVLRL